MNLRLSSGDLAPRAARSTKPGTSRALLASALIVGAMLAGCGGSDHDDPIPVLTQQTPLAVTLPAAATDIGAGWATGCAILADGSLRCWGANQFGQLGNGGVGVSCVENTATCSNGPVVVTPPAAWRAVVGGLRHACGLDNAGAAWCWGSNRVGQLGNGTFNGSSRPMAVSGGLTFTQLSVSLAGDLSCGIAAGNALYCWGTGYFGQSGTGGLGITANAPYRVAPMQTFSQISVGELHACALDAAGLAWCRGANGHGQVGDGTTIYRTLPTAVAGARAYTQIVAGSGHTCALDAAGQAFCWGATEAIGRIVATVAEQSTPAAVAGAQRFARIVAGGAHTCGVTAAGALSCWGATTFGQRGSLP